MTHRERKRHIDSDDDYIYKRRCMDMQRSLPVFKCKNELLAMIEKYQIVIVTGETGSGKSTQIPQYLMNAGYCKDGKIACTQPRRIGAVSLANRVAEEMNCRVSEKVGYSIRFEKCVSGSTSIVYMTDGVLLRELQTDCDLSEYSVVMIDEAHERTIQTDALLGIMKDVLRSRPTVKLIISSATLNAEQFAEYYDGAKIFKIEGRQHRVKIEYSKPKSEDYMEDIVERVLKIHNKRDNGDVLVFLAGQDDIDRCVSLINDRQLSHLIVLPAYSSLTKIQLARIFEPTRKNTRKVVVATNIAETSLTIDGIVYVIDSGFVKQKTYNSFFGIDQLLMTTVSRAQADQRAGRAGRAQNGKCYRMYSYRRYHKKMLTCSVPEIQRANLSNAVLQLTSIGVKDIAKFDFIDPPNSQRLKEAVHELCDLSALNSAGQLTVLGRCMAQLPLEPVLSKMLIMSSYRGCSAEMVIVVSMLCVQSVWVQLDRGRSHELHRHEGDHITLLSVYLQWRDNDHSRDWCTRHALRYAALTQARSICHQLSDIMATCDLSIVSCGPNIVLVQNTLALYYFRHNAARKEPSGGYRTVADDQIVYMHPTSALFHRQPDWVVFHELVATSNKYMRQVTKINAAFLRELVPHTF